MILQDFSLSGLSLLPATTTIFFAIFTRKVVLSLFLGALVGALLLTDFSPGNTLVYFFEEFTGIFWSWKDKTINTDKVFIMLFLLLLGVLYKLIDYFGGAVAFSRWAGEKIKSPVKAQLVSLAFGILLFIDDYMNALVSGNICRPITDRHRVSRAKLAYIVDSTSAPVSVLAPFSSWGAYIVSLIAMVFTTHQITESTPFVIFLKTIPYNFYALSALLLVLLVICFRLNVFQMAFHEKKAATDNTFDLNDEKFVAHDLNESATPKGSVWLFFIPLSILIIVTIAAMILTGLPAAQNTSGVISVLLTSLENTDPALSLMIGALASIFILFVIASRRNKISPAKLVPVFISGINAMKEAVTILIFAWLLVSIAAHMETASYLSNVVTNVVDVRFLPAMVFLVSCVTAFATGSSWGTFGIMIPIVASIAFGVHVEHHPDFFVMALSAMIAGAVFGDHCSPISDTTVLSSVGSGCDHIVHVITQLPYSIFAALSALVGYLVAGLTFSPLMGLFTTLSTLAVICFLLFLARKTGNSY